MGPKIQAALEFVRFRKDGQALITKPDSLEQALLGHTGTVITAN